MQRRLLKVVLSGNCVFQWDLGQSYIDAERVRNAGITERAGESQYASTGAVRVVSKPGTLRLLLTLLIYGSHLKRLKIRLQSPATTLVLARLHKELIEAARRCCARLAWWHRRRPERRETAPARFRPGI